MGSALARLQAGGFSIGIEAPLDNDWTPLGEQARRAARRLPGEPDLQRHAELARLTDRLGFRALWVRDVPVYDPAFGDAAQVFEVFSYLGYLAGITNDILLGTGAVVLPIREPLLTLKSARSVQRLSGDRLLLGVASGDRPVEYPLFGRTSTPAAAASASTSHCCAKAPPRACRRAWTCCPRMARPCRCSWPAWPSSNRRGSASTWMAAWLTRARHRTMRNAWRPGAPWPATSPMPASST